MAKDGSLLFDTKIDGSGMNSGLSKIGGIAAKGLAAIAGAALAATAAIVKVGSDFEQSMAKVATIADTSVMSIDELGKGVTEISNKTGQSAKSLSEALYSALSAGVKTGDSLAFVEQSAKLATAGFTTTESAVDALSTVMNGYKMSAEEVTKVSDMMLQTQNKGKTTVDELAASMANVTPIASSMNVGFDQVSAALATMTAQGIPTAQATTQLRQVFAELGKSGTVASENLKKAAEGTEYAGKSFQDLMKEGVPLNNLLDLMSDYAEKNGLSMSDMFSSIEAGQAALALSGQNSESYANNLNAMAEAAGLTEQGFNTMTDTLQGKIGILKESFTNLGISIYEGMQEPLKGIADVGIEAMDQLTQAFNEDGLEGMISVGTDIVINITTGIIEQIPMLFESGMQIILGVITGISNALPQLIPIAYNAILTLLNSLLANAPQLISAGLTLIGNLALGILNSLPQIVTSSHQLMFTLIQSIGSNAPQLLQQGIELIGQLIAGIISSIPNVLGAIGDLMGQAVNAFFNTDWVSVGTNIIQGVVNGIVGAGGSVLDSLLNVAKSAFDGVLGFFGINSPSKLMRDRVGKWLPPGIAVGAKEEIPDAVRDMDNAWNDAIHKMRPFALDYESQETKLPTKSFGSNYEYQGDTETNIENNYNIEQHFNGKTADKPSDVRRQTVKAIKRIEFEKGGKK